MHIKILRGKADIHDLNVTDTIIHCSFRPSLADCLNIQKYADWVKVIQVPGSYFKTLQPSTFTWAENAGVAVIQGDFIGYKSTEHSAFIIPDSIVNEIKKQDNEGVPDKEIMEDISILPEMRKLSERMIMEIIKQLVT